MGWRKTMEWNVSCHVLLAQIIFVFFRLLFIHHTVRELFIDSRVKLTYFLHCQVFQIGIYWKRIKSNGWNLNRSHLFSVLNARRKAHVQIIWKYAKNIFTENFFAFLFCFVSMLYVLGVLMSITFTILNTFFSILSFTSGILIPARCNLIQSILIIYCWFLVVWALHLDSTANSVVLFRFFFHSFSWIVFVFEFQLNPNKAKILSKYRVWRRAHHFKPQLQCNRDFISSIFSLLLFLCFEWKANNYIFHRELSRRRQQLYAIFCRNSVFITMVLTIFFAIYFVTIKNSF